MRPCPALPLLVTALTAPHLGRDRATAHHSHATALTAPHLDHNPRPLPHWRLIPLLLLRRRRRLLPPSLLCCRLRLRLWGLLRWLTGLPCRLVCLRLLRRRRRRRRKWLLELRQGRRALQWWGRLRRRRLLLHRWWLLVQLLQ